MPSIMPAPAPNLYGGGGIDDFRYGDVGSNLLESQANARNKALYSILNQWNQPGFQNVAEAQYRAPVTEQYRAGRQGRLVGLAQRGMQDSGANVVTERGLQRGYAGGILGALTQGQAAETARKQSLLAALQSIASGDINNINAIGSGNLAQIGANDAEMIAGLKRMIDFGEGVAKIVSIVGGGVAGGMGGGGITGAAKGAYNTANASGAIGGGGGPSPYSPNSNYTPILPSQPVSPNYSLLRGPGSLTADPAYSYLLGMGGTH